VNVVVGTDGSPGAVRALDWAACEAVARDAALRVVVAADAVTGSDAGQQVLEEAVARCAARSADLAVAGAVWPDTPAAALLSEAADAALLVVGRSGRGSRVGMHLGSVPAAVLRHAPCSVAVVAGGRTGTSPRWDGDVVVGIDGSGGDHSVLAAAFAAAAARGARLTIGHAPVAGAVRADRPAAGREFVDAAIGDWSPRYPAVDVSGRVLPDGPVRALGALSTGAGLLVLGAVGQDSYPSQLLGAVPRALAGQAACPVLVVRARG